MASGGKRAAAANCNERVGEALLCPGHVDNCVSDSAQSFVLWLATVTKATRVTQASTEESLTSREQRGADLTKKPAKRVKKRRCLAEELVRSQGILQLYCT